MNDESRESAIGAIVLDIEGTTTPIAFVYEVLFPFARRHLRDFLEEHWTAASVRDVVGHLREEWTEDRASGQEPPPWAAEAASQIPSVAAYVEWLMDRDRKSPGLKLLQGQIWEGGYRSGMLRSEVFRDVAPAVQRWAASGTKVAVYSSGSVLAQRLLFAHTPDGDLTPYFSGFFDTTAGAKTSPESYRRIAAALACPRGDLLFISDSVKELHAARQAGCRVVLCVRPGNPVQSPPADFVVINDLDDIAPG